MAKRWPNQSEKSLFHYYRLVSVPIEAGSYRVTLRPLTPYAAVFPSVLHVELELSFGRLRL